MGLNEKNKVYTLQNGIKLQLKKPSAVAARGIKTRLFQDDPEPTPPMQYIEEKGREEPNPSDPRYRAEHIEWTARTGMKVTDVVLLTGTSVKHVPDDVFSENNSKFNEWLEVLGLGLPADASDHARYLAWLKYYAATDEEFQDISLQLIKMTGVTEEHILEAEEAFRSLAYGTANSQSPSE